MNFPKIHIEEPCAESWKKMPSKENGRFCNSCNKIVVDFSNKSISEIQNYINASAKPVCGLYRKRHTTAAGKLDHFINNLEFTFSKYRLSKIAVFFISIIIFLTGCHRRLQGMYSNFDNFRNGEPSSSVNTDSTKINNKVPEKR